MKKAPFPDPSRLKLYTLDLLPPVSFRVILRRYFARRALHYQSFPSGRQSLRLCLTVLRLRCFIAFGFVLIFTYGSIYWYTKLFAFQVSCSRRLRAANLPDGFVRRRERSRRRARIPQERSRRRSDHYERIPPARAQRARPEASRGRRDSIDSVAHGARNKSERMAQPSRGNPNPCIKFSAEGVRGEEAFFKRPPPPESDGMALTSPRRRTLGGRRLRR